MIPNATEHMPASKRDIAQKGFYDSAVADRYYDIVNEGNKSVGETVDFQEISRFIGEGISFCEFGCGDGSKISAFCHLKDKVRLHGFDISEAAIARAKKTTAGVDFSVRDATNTGFPDGHFDVTASFFVLEHIPEPELMVREMLRTTKKGGKVILWFPNYGSPFFPSPPVLYGRGAVAKAALVAWRALAYPFSNRLTTPVEPIVDAPFESDFDTVSEIRMSALLRLFKGANCKIELADSLWRKTENGNPLFKLYAPFRLLAGMGLPPFVHLGPQCLVVATKTE